MSRHQVCAVVAVASTLLACASLSARAETRTWTDSTGKHKIEELRRQVSWIGWVDDQRIMTVDRNTLTMWSVDGPKGIYQITGDGMQAPAFSPGGKQFAIGTDKGFAIHDVATGDLLARVDMALGFNRQVAFSPSGMLLIVTGASTVDVYDLATGQQRVVAYAASAGAGKGICWLDEEHVLVGGSKLIHLPSQMTVCTYRHNAESGCKSRGTSGTYSAICIAELRPCCRSICRIRR